jgi:hypothetical protein
MKATQLIGIVMLLVGSPAFALTESGPCEAKDPSVLNWKGG